MLRKIFQINSERFLARWIIFIFDVCMVMLAYILASFTRHNFDLDILISQFQPARLGWVAIFYSVAFIFFKSYSGVIRHTSLKDGVQMFKAASIAIFGILILGLVAPKDVSSFWNTLYVPRSIVLIHYLMSLFLLVSTRTVVKILFRTLGGIKSSKKTKVLIYGAGVSGMITKNTLENYAERDYEVVGFFDDNSYKVGKSIQGVMVYNPLKLENKEFVKKLEADVLIISVQSNLTVSKRKQIVDLALENGLVVKVVPPANNWIQGELSIKQIQNVKIEKLLERDPIILDNVNISNSIKNRIVLVTGAAGSIGSEIACQLVHYSPKQVILLDQAESSLYDLQNELKSKYPDKFDLIQFVIGDITNYERMNVAFNEYKPQIVFHAAGYKHVPLMEDNPYESINVNIFGTKNIADLAVTYNCEKFVMVSTDKAVNPTNVMGATKRAAEIYTQSLGSKKGVKTQFIITRFGNVLGSNGSVIPIFRRQIEEGGPITITHKDITRFFMTIPEACNLVLEAGSMGKGGEIFIFDMGESVKIYDLAKKMIRLSGLKLGTDIEIKEIGLRPGEKLYEELLAVEENTKKTHHPKIMIANIIAEDPKKVREELEDMQGCLSTGDNLKMVRILKEIVPEFISNNSIFASLDMKKIVNH